MTTNIFDIAEVSISYKFGRITADRNKIKSSQCASIIAREAAADHIEHYECFYIMMLNNANQVLGISRISQGGITGTLVDVRLIFQNLLKANATAFLMFHNHPSGTLKPSEADKIITKKIKEATQFFDIKLLDHLIITSEDYLSFADEGLL